VAIPSASTPVHRKRAAQHDSGHPGERPSISYTTFHFYDPMHLAAPSFGADLHPKLDLFATRSQGEVLRFSSNFSYSPL
jgi:hypothetical protein